jgi:hypothetical protein
VANRFIPRIGGEAGIDIFRYIRLSAFMGFAGTQPIKDFNMKNVMFSAGLELNFFDPRIGGNIYARFSAATASRDADVPRYGMDSQPYYETATVISIGYARFVSL